jgi:hypothetical protein
MMRRRAQVLADGDDVDADARQVGQTTDDLIGRLSHADHQTGLGGEPGRLGPRQHRQAARIAGRRPHHALQPGNGFDVVVHHIGPRRQQQVE